MLLALIFFSACIALLAKAWNQKDWLLTSIISIPVLFCGYFLISVVVFTFGQVMPYTYFDEQYMTIYMQVVAMFCLHFIMVSFGYSAARYAPDRSRAALSYQRHLSKVRDLEIGSWAFAVAILPPLFILLSSDFGDLASRQGFILKSAQHGLMRFADLFFFPAVLVLPFMRSNVLRLFALFAIFTAFIALGSRSAVVALVVYMVIRFFLLKRMSGTKFLLWSVFTAYSLGIVLVLRTQNEGGLLAVATAFVSENPSSIFDGLVFGLNYIFNLSFVLIGELFMIARPKEEFFLYSILPLPSFVFDMTAEYDAHMRFRANIPFSGFGYAVLFLGPVLYAAMVFATSFVFFTARRLFVTRKDLFERVACFAVVVFPFLILLQYNLRTGTRLAYTFVALYFMVSLVRRMRFSVAR